MRQTVALVANINRNKTDKKSIEIARDEPFLVFRHYYIVVFKDLILTKRDTTYTSSSKLLKAASNAKSPFGSFSNLCCDVLCAVFDLVHVHCSSLFICFYCVSLSAIPAHQKKNRTIVIYCTRIKIINSTFCFMSTTSVILMSLLDIPSNSLPLKCSFLL